LAAAGQLGRTAAGIVMLAVIGATAALAAPHPPAEPGLARAPLAAPHGAPGQAHRILDEPPGAVGSSGAFTRHRMR
jgi:hypothetical protein